jgi:hypothetical protein
MTETLLARRIAAFVVLGMLFLPAVGHAQFETPNTAGTAGGACTTGHYAFPDSNGYALKCVSGVWVIAAGSGGTVSIGSQYQMGYYASTGSTISGDYRIVTDSSNNLNIGTSAATAGALKIGGSNAISFPPTDTNLPDASIAIGSGALNSMPAMPVGSAIYSNTAVGYQALYSSAMTTAAVNNTAVGYTALRNVTSGNRNTAAGMQALGANTTGGNNTGFGYDTLYFNQTGSNNTAIGDYAGLGTSSGSYANSVFVGFEAGQDIFTGSNNTVLGYEVASTTLNTGSNNILIGTNSAVDTPAQGTNNYLNIGNLIYGTSIGTAASRGM